ncbi:hypothetical protein PHMEG_00024693 [Phytophthora megakarya]|uniref:Uncharacterized protein n=1 Tax=Phytophthora megakarya TaxID=4795 RepID=A0A225VFJ1_9STRA|nr:hypothetical protein PHMEG_00024693 [Phytophthora megakarya]
MAWERLSFRSYDNEKQAVMSFDIYERKHWVSPEAVKRFLSRMADSEEHRKFKLALERLKKVWFKYNKEQADRADNVRTFLPGRMWPWCVGPDVSLPIETLLYSTLPFNTIENLMWVPGSADWCAEAALVDKSEPYRVDRLTCPEQHPYNTVYVPCNTHVPLFLPANSTVEVSVHKSSLTRLWSRKTSTLHGIAPFVEPTRMRKWRMAKLERTMLTPSPLWT